MTEAPQDPNEELIPDLELGDDETENVVGGATMVELTNRDSASGLPTGQ